MEIHEVAAALSSDARAQFLLWLKDPETHLGQQYNGHLTPHGASLSLLSSKAGLSVSATSRHLERLLRVGFVRTTRVAPFTFYARDEDAIAAGFRVLDQVRR
ncbi:ArsR/SmtB family transcription factor [Amycolatopsis thailandensis]|uniref:ArsR/SmtB family transcription factor n=1 Tax=Amycolatopsis thailandensis TaxID=589330 RepID=UPI003631EA74